MNLENWPRLEKKSRKEVQDCDLNLYKGNLKIHESPRRPLGEGKTKNNAQFQGDSTVLQTLNLGGRKGVGPLTVVRRMDARSDLCEHRAKEL